MREFAAFVSGNRAAPVAFEKLVDTTRLTLAARQRAIDGKLVVL
jgi:hypothetical protein